MRFFLLKDISNIQNYFLTSGVVWTFPAVRLKTDEDTFEVVANNGVTDEIILKKAK